eukprot:4357609-Alexandrium_andersonii.AAC.1
MADWALATAVELGPSRVRGLSAGAALLAEATLWVLSHADPVPDGPLAWPGWGPRELLAFRDARRSSGAGSAEVLVGRVLAEVGGSPGWFTQLGAGAWGRVEGGALLLQWTRAAWARALG